MAHVTAASPEKRLQVDSAHLSDQSPPMRSDMEDLSNLTQPDTAAQIHLHDDHAQSSDHNLSPPTVMLESTKNDLSCSAQLAPQATAASPERRLQVDTQLISDPSRKKPRRGCRAGKKHRRNAIRKGYITAAQGSRGSQGRGKNEMKTAAQGSRGPQGRGNSTTKSAAHKLSKHRYNNIDAEHTLSKRGHKNTTTMRPATSRRSKRGVRVGSKDSEDHDIGRRLDRGELQEFITKRLDLGLDCLLVLKKGAPGYATAITAL